MELLALLVGWIVFSHVFAAVVPALIAGTLELIAFLFLCLIEVFKLAIKFAARLLALIFRALRWLLVRILHYAYLGLVFVLIFAQETLRSALAASADQEPPPAEQQVPEPDPYASALALLGLAPGFTASDLHRAYRQAIRKAHPDTGGSHAQAQAVNSARDLIARRHGWK